MTMKMPTRGEVEQIKARYTKGLRIELIQMGDPLSRILDNGSYQYF